MTTTRIGKNFVSISLLALSSAFGPGCASEGAGDGEAPLIAAPTTEAPFALRVERAARSLDRGEDPKEARAELEAALADPRATATERDEATLVLSRALEASGEKDEAIVVIEKLLAAHAEDREWAASAEVEKRLRKLVTGEEKAPSRRLTSAPRPASPFARELAKFFEPDAAGRYHVRVLAFGGDRGDASERLGTFDVGGALRSEKEKSCPSCEVNVDNQTHRESTWLGLVRRRAELPSSLVVIYYDLEGGRIPARYDADLPLPTAEIEARLAKGKGLVAARERPGAPPVILIAAPRFAQLDNVETNLAGMSELPLDAVSVDVPESLEAEEIQSVVRASFRDFRACYEAVLATNPSAAGRISLDFTVEPSGQTSKVKATADSASIASMETCMLDAGKKLVFPAATKETTVVYPVMFSH